MAILVEWSAAEPCVDRRVALLDLAIGAGDGRSTVAARSHARTCARCRRFLETTQLERRGVAGMLAGQAEATSTKADWSYGVFRDWLDRSLKHRADLDLADATWKVARWLLRLDPTMTGAYRPEPVSLGQELRGCAAAMEACAEEQRALGKLLARVADAGDELSDLAIRQSLITKLCDTADGLAGGVHSGAQLVMAWTEFGPDRTKTYRCLERAERSAKNAVMRVGAVNDLAVLSAIDGNLDSAIDLCDLAYKISSEWVSSQWNATVWNLARGDFNSARTMHERVRLTISKMRRRPAFGSTILAQQVQRSAAVIGATARQAESRAQFMIDLFREDYGGTLPEVQQ